MTDQRDGPRFLIARMSAIGDTILTLPVACALREAYPNCFIAWAVEQTAAPMVQGHEAVDRVVVLPRGWFVSPRKINAARKQLRKLRIESTIDCQSITKTALACMLTGAKHRIGCRGQYGSELSPLLNNHLVPTKRTHLTDRSLELIRPLGINEPDVRWGLPLSEESRKFASNFVRASELGSEFAVINPGASWDSKLWEIDRFAPVARHIQRQYGMRTLVVWGGGRERAWAEKIVAASGGCAVMAPNTDLVQLAALIGLGRVFVSSDTGPLHMAVAVGTPSVGLYGTTRPEDCGPYGSPHIALQVQYQSGSRKERRRADNSAMRMISVDMVCRAVDRHMQAAPIAEAA